MRGTDHYDKADGILADLDARSDYELDDRNEFELRVAAVHAQLATAGALAALIAEGRRGVAILSNISTRPSPFDLERRPQ